MILIEPHAFVSNSDDKDDKVSQKVLIELENIDDECDQNDIAFVKIDDDKEAAEWGIDEIPTIVCCIDSCKHDILAYYFVILTGFLRTWYSTYLRRRSDEGKRFAGLAGSPEATL